MLLPESNAIVGGAEDMAAAKIAVFKECGIEVAAIPNDLTDALLRAAKSKGVKLTWASCSTPFATAART